MESLIVMQRDGFYKLEPSYIGRQLNALDRFASQRVPQIVHNLYVASYGLRVNVSLAINNNYPILFSILPYLRLNCHWFVRDDYIWPDFTSPPSGELNWVPPQDTSIFFCTSKDKSYVGLVSDGIPYQLPIPNTYEDGKCCLNIELPSNLIDRHIQSLQQFHDGRWNHDLFPDWKGRASEYVFRFTIHDEQAMTSMTENSDGIYQTVPRDGTGKPVRDFFGSCRLCLALPEFG